MLSSNNDGTFEYRSISFKADDAGTRIQHLMDLLDTWNTGLSVLTTTEFISKSYPELHKKRVEQLKVAIEMLESNINVLTGYHNKVSDLREEIDAIPKIKKENTDAI
jgi:hypothetical protein